MAKKLEGAENNNDVKLKYYSLYKQATVGDVQGTQPWAVQVTDRAKWDAWNARKGETKEDSMAAYVELMTENDADWQTRDGHEELLTKMTDENWKTTL